MEPDFALVKMPTRSASDEVAIVRHDPRLTSTPPKEHSLDTRRTHHRSRREEYKRICEGLELAQPGLNNDVFTERQIKILVNTDAMYKLPASIRDKIYTPHYQEWIDQSLKNNRQVGVRNVDVVPDDHRTNRCLEIQGQEYNYFEFMATNRRYHEGDADERKFLAEFVKSTDRDFRDVIQHFANPLSVGVTLFCEDGQCLVITQRSIKTSSGSGWEAGKIFNAVGENTNLKDQVGSSIQGSVRVSPFKTAWRGLKEEMGLRISEDYDATDFQLHTFTFDRQIYDYKFFGYLVTSLTRDEVEERWERAVDKMETHKEPIFVKAGNKRECLEIVGRIRDERKEWSKEAIFSTLRALELYKEIPLDELLTPLTEMAAMSPDTGSAEA
jgi:hypothetical protein